MKKDKFENYIKVFQENHGILRANRAIELGIPKHVIYEMQREGELVQELRIVSPGAVTAFGKSRPGTGRASDTKRCYFSYLCTLFS